jgi:hypothetical protein
MREMPGKYLAARVCMVLPFMKAMKTNVKENSSATKKKNDR